MVKFASAPRPTLEDLERAFSSSGNVDQEEAKRAEDDEDSHHDSDRVLYPPAAMIRDSADGSNVDILTGEASKSIYCERDETENKALQKELQILREKNTMLERQLAAAEELSRHRNTQLNAKYHGHEENIQELKQQLSSLQVTYNLLQRTGVHTSVCKTHEVPSSNNVGGATPSSNAAGEEMERDEGGMPPGGTVYGALISTPKVGVIFFKPKELTGSLFRGTAREFVKGLKERPVVAFMTEQSSACAAGVKLGDVLLKVNGVDVSSPEEANRLIRAGPRPLPLLFHVPNTKIGFVEGEFMVKYSKWTSAVPKRSIAWKTKYVVIGGIIAQPGMMQIFNSKVGYFVHLILYVYGCICGID